MPLEEMKRKQLQVIMIITSDKLQEEIIQNEFGAISVVY